MSWQDIVRLIFDILLAVIPVVSVILHSYGVHVLCKHDTNKDSEVKEMQYGSGNDYSVKTKGRTFDLFKKQYELNEKTNVLEETGETIDIQKEINSYLDTCLEKILQRLLDQEVDEEAEYGERGQLKDKLDELQESIEASYDTAEFLRRKLNLGEDLDPTEIFDRSLAILEAEENAKKASEKINKEKEQKNETQTSNENAE